MSTLFWWHCTRDHLNALWQWITNYCFCHRIWGHQLVLVPLFTVYLSCFSGIYPALLFWRWMQDHQLFVLQYLGSPSCFGDTLHTYSCDTIIQGVPGNFYQSSGLHLAGNALWKKFQNIDRQKFLYRFLTHLTPQSLVNEVVTPGTWQNQLTNQVSWDPLYKATIVFLGAVYCISSLSCSWCTSDGVTMSGWLHWTHSVFVGLLFGWPVFTWGTVFKDAS